MVQPIKLFISYQSNDATEVDLIADQLRMLKDESGNNVYDVWQDKKRLVGGQNWWDKILDAIIDSQIFIFMISDKSLDSAVCKQELDYADKRNRPIIPLILKENFFYVPAKDNYDVHPNFAARIPRVITEKHLHYIFQTKNYQEHLQRAIERCMANYPEDFYFPKPANPYEDEDVAQLYRDACAAVDNYDFVKAEDLFSRLRRYKTFEKAAHKWLVVIKDYKEMIELDYDRTRQFIHPKWQEYENNYPLQELGYLYDPRDFKTRFGQETSKNKGKKVESILEVFPKKPIQIPSTVVITAPIEFESINLPSVLPAPFAWSYIPNGDVTLIGGTFHNKKQRISRESYIPSRKNETYSVEGFYISKYPITNAQFAKFIDAGNYQNEQFWTEEGWQKCLAGIAWRSKSQSFEATNKPWTEPRFWQEEEWNQAEYPLVGVSWYEAVAYCNWMTSLLPENSGLKVVLPSEKQWQRSAQALRDGGDSKYLYPWGNDWDAARCNCNVNFNGKTRTSPVQQYEGLGNSPCGVVDLVGNTWEWCSTEYFCGDSDCENPERYVVRGSSYNNHNVKQFQNDLRYSNSPEERLNYIGFRIALVRNN